MTIPFTYTYRFGASGSSSVTNLTVTLTRQYGRKIKKIGFVPYNAQEYTQYAYDHSNVNGTKVNSYQTSIDSRPLSDYVLNCYNPNSSVNPTVNASLIWASPATFSDDYRENRKYLLGSVIQNYSQYQTNWMHIDAFGVNPTLEQNKSALPEENIDDGFSLLDGDHVYTLQANTIVLPTATSNCNANGLILYLFCTFVRTLVVTPQGIAFME